jgi:hypothetical protein
VLAKQLLLVCSKTQAPMAPRTYLLHDRGETLEIPRTDQPLWIVHSRSPKAPYGFTLTVHEHDSDGVVLGACRIDGDTTERVHYLIDDPTGIDLAEWSVMEPAAGICGTRQRYPFKYHGHLYEWEHTRSLSLSFGPKSLRKLALYDSAASHEPLAICTATRKEENAEREGEATRIDMLADLDSELELVLLVTLLGIKESLRARKHRTEMQLDRWAGFDHLMR